MEPAELVAVGIAQIGEVERSEGVAADSRRILDGNAARLDARLVPGVDLLRAIEKEPDGRTIAMGRGCTVDRRSDHEHGALAAIAQPPLVIGLCRLAEQRVI